MDLIGKVLGNRYEVLEKIGIGGMATVYRAKCKLLNRYVAVKVLKDEYSKDTLFVKRFKVEAQSAASLTHPNIVSVYDVGEEDGINYIVMELLEGDTLKDYIEKKGKLGLNETIDLSIQIASALETAHRSKIIHRDIKPQNIVLTRNMTQAKVTDFGIAKMSNAATITTFGASTIGSVHYFSPEHAKGGYTDEKSDIYSLGIVMYEMATGVLPFNADSPVSVALKQIQEEPKMPKDINGEVSDALNSIILKAMAKNTKDRYQSATELLEDLNEAKLNPSQKFIKSNSDISTSDTQIIPILGMKSVNRSATENDDQMQSSRKSARREYSLNRSPGEDVVSDIKEESEDNEEPEVFVTKPKKKMNKKMLFTFIGIGVVCIGIIVGLTINLFAKANKGAKDLMQKAPKLVGLVYEDAKKEYNEKGLLINLEKYDYSSEYEDGVIMSQSVDKGKELPTAGKISVVVSKGAKKVEMIDVVGKDYTVAKYELEALELKPEFEFKVDANVKQNLIISQEDEVGKELKAGDTVKIVVSSGNGKSKVLVPNVISMSEAEAKKTLQDRNLAVNVTYSEDSSKANGVVLSQSKKQNEEVEEGTMVEITINKVQKSKTVQIDIAPLISSNIEQDSDVTVKVVAKVEGVSNTVYEKKSSAPYAAINVTVNGYTSAELTIYINGEKKDTKTITF